MDQTLFTVYDSKAANYLPPFVSRNQATALREFKDAVNQEGHAFNTHAEDFTLWHIGTFNSEKATLTQEVPTLVANAHDIYEPPTLADSTLAAFAAVPE